MTARTPAVLLDIAAERAWQQEKWGEQNHPNGTGPGIYQSHASALPNWQLRDIAKRRTDRHTAEGIVTYADILLEEVAEALAEEDPAKLRAELIQVAANMLEAGYGPYADQLWRIASRLSVGRRIPSDILWLRQMADAVTDGLCGPQGEAEKLLQLALKGATAPLVVFRAVDPPPRAVNDLDWDNGRPLL